METQTKKEFFPPAIPQTLRESTDPQDQELVRIGKLANRLWANYDFSTRVAEPFQLFAAAICNLDAHYFQTPICERKSTAQLLSPDVADDAKRLYKWIGESELGGILKARLCSEAAGWLKANGASNQEIAFLKRSFDYEKFMDEFWLEEEK